MKEILIIAELQVQTTEKRSNLQLVFPTGQLIKISMFGLLLFNL
jgi:hypothetical protein